ncbi:MAG: T9SS type A sorting domain-containing protein [Candidatus Zixiibacteriota bacterium]|nr:MAG: T9SS type A sorting domain-containing protein [candidate division Zixibacteria bacterium]
MKNSLPLLILIIAVTLSVSAYPQNIEFVGSYQLSNSFEVMVDWPLAYVCQHFAFPNFIVLDVTDPENIEMVGLLNYSHSTQDFDIQGDYAFLANDWDGLQIVDISYPTDPHYVGGIDFGDRAYAVFVKGTIAYVADGYAGLFLIDISDVTNPTVISSYSNNFSASGIVVRGDIAYMTDHSTLLQTIDVVDPFNPDGLDSYYGQGYARRGIALYSHYALISAWAYGIHIVDIADPAYIVPVTLQPTPGNCFSIFCKYDKAYVTNFEAGIQVYDISDPNNPLLKGYYQTPGNARGIAAREDYIYVADEGSLQILRLTTTSTGESDSELPLATDISRNYPNPFNASTTIEIELSDAANIDLSVYNINGQKIENLKSGSIEAGSYSVVWDAHDVSSGVYFARLTADGISKSLKMQLLK